MVEKYLRACYYVPMNNTKNRRGLDTYVYIDVSNIRNACRISCGFYLDFIKLYKYFRKRYPNLRDVRYYEGIYQGDNKKISWFKKLGKVGYTICPLRRKKYVQNPKMKTFDCWRCGATNNIEVLGEVVKYKSNVDVYLVSDMLVQVAKAKGPINIVLVSCDGDYVEAIKSVFELTEDAFVTVLATPNKRDRNLLSYRLRYLFRDLGQDRYMLENIETIKDIVSLKQKTGN